MQFNSYLSYDEYKELGGSVDENTFPNLERKAQRYLDYITFDRIKLLPEVPDVVKEVIVEFMNKLDNFDKQSVDGQMISQYSNGVENITYRRTTSAEVTRGLYRIAKTWLPDYLVNRSVNFDVTKYLQSESYNP